MARLRRGAALCLLCSAAFACRMPTPASICIGDKDCPEDYVCSEQYSVCVPQGDAGSTSDAGVVRDERTVGIAREIDVTPGQDLVLRAVGHSDGEGVPFAALLRAADDREIASLVGTETSTRGAPDVLLFTAEVPDGVTAVKVVLGNAAGVGAVTWHQVELLPNLLDNPSFEGFEYDTQDGVTQFEPVSWDVSNTSEVSREADAVHSGSGSVRLIGNEKFNQAYQAPAGLDNNRFYGVGGYFWNFVGDSPSIYVTNGSFFPQNRRLGGGKMRAGVPSETRVWQHARNVGRRFRIPGDGSEYNNWNDNVCWGGDWNSDTNVAVDDAYVVALDPVLVDVRRGEGVGWPVDTHIRIDGADSAIQVTDFLYAEKGSVFAELYVPTERQRSPGCLASMTLMHLSADQDNEVLVTADWDGRVTAKLRTAEDEIEVSSASGAFPLDQLFKLELRYDADLELLVEDGTVLKSAMPSDFASAPTTLALGSTTGGDGQCGVAVPSQGATFSRVVPSDFDGGLGDVGLDGGYAEVGLDGSQPLVEGGQRDRSMLIEEASLSETGPVSLDATTDRGMLVMDSVALLDDVGSVGFDVRGAVDGGAVDVGFGTVDASGLDAWVDPCTGVADTCRPQPHIVQGVGKRRAPGPFDYGVSYGRDPSNALEGGGDRVIFGQQATGIGPDFTAELDAAQGTVLAWVTPAWNSAQLSTEEFRHFWSVAGLRVGVRGGDKRLVAGFHDQSAEDLGIPLSLVAGQTYLVVMRWDADRPLDADHHVLVNVDDAMGGAVHEPFAPFPAQAQHVVGAAAVSGNGSAHALIEGFTVYRRPLFDGSYGVDIGDNDEIALLRTGDHHLDVVALTGSWDVVFALPTDQALGVLRNSRQAWSHPHADNLLSRSAFFLEVGDGDVSGWLPLGTPVLGSTPVEQRIYRGGVTVGAATP